MLQRYNTPKGREINIALAKLEKIILETLDFKKLVQRVVDSILYELDYLRLGYRIVVLALVDKRKKVLTRVSISQTPEAEKGIAELPVPYTEFIVPLSARKNYSVRVLIEKKPLITYRWSDILSPPLSPKNAKILQKKIGIKTSMIYPLLVQNKAIGIMIFSMVKSEKLVSEQEKELLARFTDIVALTVQNSKLYSSLESTTQKLRKANKRLRELDKLKDEFVSITSHELRTPMTAVKSYLWMVLNKDKHTVGSKAKEHLKRAYISTERTINLVNDMLDVSRIEGNRFEIKKDKVDIGELAEEVVKELKIKADERKIRLTVKKESLPKVIADEERIHQVLDNLIGNAIKFTQGSGKIKVVFSRKNGFVQTSVIDTGTGISKSDQKRLFKKFSRLENSFVSMAESGGTGLGLFISKQIINLHKGKIWVESKGGGGATFSFTLPAAG